MNNFSVSIIIPNYNGANLLSKNLPAIILAKKNLKNCIKEIIVVDDASSDNSLLVLKNEFPEVKVIKHKINRGFSSSVNTGVRASTGNLVLLLNTDITVNSNFLVNVFSSFDIENVFGISLHEKGYGASRGYFSNGVIQLGQYKEIEKVINTFFVSGGSGIFRKSIWNELGGLDERLLSPFYWEDLDISYRAWKSGYVNLWNPKSLVMHNHESTIGNLPKRKVVTIREVNQLLVIWKNIHSKKMMQKHIWFTFLRCVKHIGYLRIVFMALLKYGVVARARRRELKMSVLSDEAVFEKFHE